MFSDIFTAVYDEARSTTAFSQRSERPDTALSRRSGDYSVMSGAGTRAESRLEPETPVVIKTLKSVHVQREYIFCSRQFLGYLGVS